MIISNIPSNLVCIKGTGATVALSGLTRINTIIPRTAEYAIIRAIGGSFTTTTDGRTPEAGTVGRSYGNADDYLISREDAEYAKFIADDATALDVEFFVGK